MAFTVYGTAEEGGPEVSVLWDGPGRIEGNRPVLTRIEHLVAIRAGLPMTATGPDVPASIDGSDVVALRTIGEGFWTVDRVTGDVPDYDEGEPHPDPNIVY